jgi:uncharacterized protein
MEAHPLDRNSEPVSMTQTYDVPGAFRTGPRRRSTAGAVLLSVGLLLVGFLAGCERDTRLTTPNGSQLVLPRGVDVVSFDAGMVEIHSGETVHRVTAEIAETPAQRERGLMYRTRMPEEAGMIFVYPSEQVGGFWMYNTRIPLSIAYADGEGVIFQITDMQPCESPYATLCRTYQAQHPFQYALEMNQSYFTTRSIRPGDRIVQRPRVAIE